MKLGVIFSPTDFSEVADHALRQAVALARHTGARLHLFHAVLLHADGALELETQLDEQVERLEDAARERLGKKADDLAREGVDVEISTAPAVSAGAAILARIEELRPDLVVIGTHGRTGLGKLLMGSVAAEVLRNARCSVLTQRKEMPVVAAPFARVLVPVGFMEPSRAALELARALASSDAALIMLHVLERPIYPQPEPGQGSPAETDPLLPGRVQQDLRSWAGREIGRILVREGDVVPEILKTIADEQVQMVVMGTRGLSGVERFLLGSVTGRVVRQSPVAVLAVKAPS